AQLQVDAVERRRVLGAVADSVRQLRREAPAVLVADVDDRDRRRLREEESPLRLEVRLHVAVEVEVVLAEVREDEDAEADAVEPVEDGRVRRSLHRARTVAGIEHLTEGPLQVDRLGGRPDDAATLAADARLDRPEQARPPAGGGEDGEEEERRGRLAARAGDADDLELARRLAEEDVRRRRHRGAGVADDDLRHVELERPLDDERDGAVLDRLLREVVPVRPLPGDAEEDVSPRDGPRVVGEIDHLDRRAPEHVHRLERYDEARQIHPEKPTASLSERVLRTRSLSIELRRPESAVSGRLRAVLLEMLWTGGLSCALARGGGRRERGSACGSRSKRTSTAGSARTSRRRRKTEAYAAANQRAGTPQACALATTEPHRTTRPQGQALEHGARRNRASGARSSASPVASPQDSLRNLQVGRDFEVLEVEGGDLLEGGCGDEAA